MNAWGFKRVIKLYKTYQFYIFPLVTVLSSLFLIFFVIYPQSIKLISNQNALGELSKRSELLKTKVEALENYNVESLKGKLNTALTAYPTEIDYGNIIGMLELISLNSGFNITEMSFAGSSQKSEKSNSFGVNLSLIGNKSLFLGLLKNFENSHRIMKVSNIEIGFGKPGDQESFSVSLLLEILYAALPQSLGKVDAPAPELTQKDEELLEAIARLNTNIVPVSTSDGLDLTPRGKLNPFE